MYYNFFILTDKFKFLALFVVVTTVAEGRESMPFDSNIGLLVTNCRSTVFLSPARNSRESKINKLTTVFIDCIYR